MLQKLDREHSNDASGPFSFHILKTKGLNFQEREGTDECPIDPRLCISNSKLHVFKTPLVNTPFSFL